ncbi:MAG: hypothetical protein AAGJ84_05545 [Pseudomonadota bacterium]
MTRILIDAGEVRVFLTRTGYIAFDSHELAADEADAAFGEKGPLRPRRLLDFVAAMLDMVAAAPEKSDAAGLEAFADDLKSSLTRVETMRARLVSD